MQRSTNFAGCYSTFRVFSGLAEVLFRPALDLPWTRERLVLVLRSEKAFRFCARLPKAFELGPVTVAPGVETGAT